MHSTRVAAAPPLENDAQAQSLRMVGEALADQFLPALRPVDRKAGT
ncbi:hypothetical protein [Rhizobium rhizogenes]|nr:hypothetical protein [Rhizobium rhizogenes]NTI78462.1 hypothetical protein [Rhizobium rhizogenes]